MYMYVCNMYIRIYPNTEYPIPNTQYHKRTSKDPVSANISPQY